MIWLLVVAAGLGLTAVAVALGARLGTRGAPFIGDYRLRLGSASLAAPVVAAAVLLAARAGVHERLPWRWLLLAGYLAAAAWAFALALVDGGVGLAAALTEPTGYAPDVPAVAGDPIGFLRHFVVATPGFTPDTRQHPPAPVLLLWALGRLGVTRPAAVGAVLTLIGCLSVPFAALATRSLCGAATARRLVPVLVLAPYAVWLAVSMDAVTTACAAAFVACGTKASEHRQPPGRSPAWAAAAGLLLGVAALFSYSVAWLSASLILVYFVRRRPLLNLWTGAAALVPLALVRAAGFVWPDGLTAAQADFSERVGPHRSWLLWIVLDVVVLVIACGPAVVASARKIRRTPGWPFLVGAGLSVGFALVSGLSRGEVERSWLPYYPWLLVAAVAPEVRPSRGDPHAPDSAATPLLLVGLGVATAVVVEAVLRTPW